MTDFILFFETWEVEVRTVNNKELQYSSTPTFYIIRAKCCQEHAVSQERISKS